MRQALFAGSFDPFTLGHLDTVEQAAAMFDRLTIAVAVNAGKGRGLFDLEQRVAFVRAGVTHLPNVTVTTCGAEYVVNFAERIGCQWLVRGLPTFADFSYEYDLFHINRETNPRLVTVFFMCDKAEQQIRSSNIRAQLGLRHWPRFVRRYLPEPVLRAMVELDAERRWRETFPERVEVFGDRLRPWLGARPYHDFRHVLHLLDLAEEFDWRAPREAVRAACWFHDARVDSDADLAGAAPGTAERQSAQAAGEVFADAPWRDTVDRLIAATAPGAGVASATDADTALFRALDWSVLAFPPEEYDDHVARIRQEYIPVFGVEKYQAGREAFLRAMISRAREHGLFSDAVAFTAHPAWRLAESQAADNLRRELTALREENRAP